MAAPLSSPKDFLGIGWTFPVGVDSNGMIKTSRYEEVIKESILIILGTSPGERCMQADFGCSARELVFANINLRTVEHIKWIMREALIRWEPRINVNSIDVSIKDIDTGKLIITINYTIIVTNNRFNLVYPFYLKEG